MKKLLLIIFTVLFAQYTVLSTNHTVNTQGMTFAPSSLTINLGDTVTFNNTGGFHNLNGTIATFPQNPASFSNPTGVSAGWSYVYVFTLPGTYNYQCDPHLPGMVGSITVNPQIDCDGIVNGIAAVDSCGTCHKSYVYAGMGVLNYIDTYADTLNFQGMFVLAGSAMDQQFNPNWINDPNSCSNTVYDIVANSNDHTTLKIAIDSCSLDGALSGPGPFTLFAPTDAAFNNLPAGTVTALLNDIPQLTDILKHHVVTDSVMSGMLSNGQVVTTLLGTDITVTINATGVFIDNAQVTLADLVADNGVVHVIDAVLLPPKDCKGITNGTALVDTCGICHQAYIYNFITHQVTFVDNANLLIAGVDYDPSTETVVLPDDVNNPYWNDCPNTVYDIVANSNDHTTLKTAISACSLDGALSGPGPFTLFAPTDAAFNNLPAGTVTALLNDIPQLTDILKHHVVTDSVMSGMLSNGQVVTTLLGTDITVTINATGVYIDNALVTVADLVADNGVVHVIDAVLLPNNTSINDYNLIGESKMYLYSTNILGEKISRSLKNQLIIDVYNDGSVIKRFNNR